jgi:hypothetical protein
MRAAYNDNQFDPMSNPEGIISLAVAESHLM